MLFAENDVTQIVRSVWSTVLGFQAEPDQTDTAEAEGHWTGCVQITGAWEGAVVLTCPSSLAREATGQVFGVPVPEVTADQVRDLLGELTNILAGNLKALLPEVSSLSLPTVTSGDDYRLAVLDSRLLMRAGFRSRGKAFALFIHVREPSDGAAGEKRSIP